MKPIEFTPPQLHEVVTALHRNRARILQRIRYNEKKMQAPDEQARWELDPNRKLYLETIQTCRHGRVATIDGLLSILEQEELNSNS